MEQRRMDYHLHTTHSMDGQQTMDELCRTMIDLGVDEICLTEHIEPGHPEPGADVPPVWADWLADIDRCREKYPQLIIRKGIEIGENPGYEQQIEDMLAPLSLDFRLLKVVFLDLPFKVGFALYGKLVIVPGILSDARLPEFCHVVADGIQEIAVMSNDYDCTIVV